MRDVHCTCMYDFENAKEKENNNNHKYTVLNSFK